MNVIYQYVNETKKSLGEKPFLYLGCKAECDVMINEDGSEYLYAVSDKRVYYGSSSNIFYWEDWKNGDRFTVEILKEVPERSELRKIEQEYLLKYNVKNNEDYYNLTNSALSPRHDGTNTIVNQFGETYNQFSSRMSRRSKRDNNAKKMGFISYGHLIRYIKHRYDETKNWATISKELGSPNKNFSRVTTNPYDLDKMESEICKYENDSDMIFKIRHYITLGASIDKISELLGLEIPSIRYLLGEFYFGDNFTMVAKSNMMTDREFEIEVTKRFLLGENYSEISKHYNGSATSIRRFVERCVRRNLKPEDLT